jgi:hypothetical protein
VVIEHSLHRRFQLFRVARAEEPAHVDSTSFGELPKRLAGIFLIEDPLAGVADVTAAVCSGQVGFLLAPSNGRHNLWSLDRSGLVGLDYLFNFIVVAICYAGQRVAQIVNAVKSSSVRILLYPVFPGNFASELLTLIEELNECVGRLALLDRKRSSFRSIQQISNVVMRICDLPAILYPRVQTCDCHVAGPLMANYE